jgi:hypothetical protein
MGYSSHDVAVAPLHHGHPEEVNQYLGWGFATGQYARSTDDGGAADDYARPRHIPSTVPRRGAGARQRSPCLQSSIASRMTAHAAPATEAVACTH